MKSCQLHATLVILLPVFKQTEEPEEQNNHNFMKQHFLCEKHIFSFTLQNMCKSFLLHVRYTLSVPANSNKCTQKTPSAIVALQCDG